MASFLAAGDDEAKEMQLLAVPSIPSSYPASIPANDLAMLSANMRIPLNRIGNQEWDWIDSPKEIY